MYILTTIISKPPDINCSWFFIGWLYLVFCVDYCRWAGLCFCNWSIFPNFFYESWIVKATFFAGKPLQNDITIVDLYRCTLFINLWMFKLWIWCFWKLILYLHNDMDYMLFYIVEYYYILHYCVLLPIIILPSWQSLEYADFILCRDVKLSQKRPLVK